MGAGVHERFAKPLNGGAASTPTGGRRLAGELGELPVRVDHEPQDFIALVRLAATHGLSAYDAAYLALALRRSLTLVSLDVQLIAAAKRLGHPVITAPAERTS